MSDQQSRLNFARRAAIAGGVLGLACAGLALWLMIFGPSYGYR